MKHSSADPPPTSKYQGFDAVTASVVAQQVGGDVENGKHGNRAAGTFGVDSNGARPEEGDSDIIVDVGDRTATFAVPSGTSGWWMAYAGSFVVWLIVSIVVLFVFSDTVDMNKPTKAFCSNEDDMREHLCIIAVGQYAYGIVTIGQFGVGLVNFSQIGIGVFAAFGQIQGSCGLAAAQITSASYILFAQIGLGLVRVHQAMIGWQIMWVCRRVNDKQPAAFVSCCFGPNANPDCKKRARRRHRGW